MNFEKLYETFEQKKQHGFCCPLFFAKTTQSSQIGEFPDIKVLCDLASKCGFSVVQLLPLFDTGQDASPYSARSCFALNPIYLSLKILPGIDTSLSEFQKLYEPLKEPFFNYSEIYELKYAILKSYFQKHHEKILSDPEFLEFKKSHSWLEAYSAFCIYKEKTSMRPELWEIEAEEVNNKNEKEAEFFKVIQFFCYKQLLDAAIYAKKKNIHLKGDIPILLSPNSVEMWTHRELFDFELTVGAPPDYFSSEGQAWGFPMMRFVAKPQACASFWRSRIDEACRFFSLYRIDHAVGFFRFWVIPRGKSAKQGFFFPASEADALSNARHLFDQLFRHSPMTPIAEDLGAIPEFVKTFFKDTRLCGTKVLRWERDFSKQGMFLPLSSYPHYSMTTISTHDSTFFFDDWNDDKGAMKQLCQMLEIPYMEIYSEKLHKEILKKVHQSPSLFIINMIQEYLFLYPKLKGKLYRVNDPRPNQKNNWSTCMGVPLEEILEDHQFLETIRSIIG